MALFSECSLKCARKKLDTADIVREAIYRQLREPRGDTSHKPVFYEQVDCSQGLFLFFPSLRCCFCCGPNARRMLFSTGFLFALWMSLSEARCGLGFNGESMLPFLERLKKPKRARSHRNTGSSQQFSMVRPQAASA